MEDLFSSIVVAIIAIISIIIKAVGNKPQKSPEQEPLGGDIFRPEPQSIPLPQQQKVEQSSHPDSMETIFDEINSIGEDTNILPQIIIVDHVDGDKLECKDEFLKYIRCNWRNNKALI